MKGLFNREPATFIGVLNAFIALGVGFGLKVTPQQVALINAAAISLGALITRSQVSPASPSIPINDPTPKE